MRTFHHEETRMTPTDHRLDDVHERLHRAITLAKAIEALDSCAGMEVTDLATIASYLVTELEAAEAALEGVLCGDAADDGAAYVR
jgi:hypothetical protein